MSGWRACPGSPGAAAVSLAPAGGSRVGSGLHGRLDVHFHSRYAEWNSVFSRPSAGVAAAALSLSPVGRLAGWADRRAAKACGNGLPLTGNGECMNGR